MHNLYIDFLPQGFFSKDVVSAILDAMRKSLAFEGARIMVTGHSGFSGTWLCHLLEAQGAEILGFSRDSSSFSTIYPDVELTERFPTVFGKIEDAETLTQAVRKFQPEIVIHLAAQSLVLEGYSDPVGTFKINALGTAQVLQSSLTSDALRGVLIVTTDKVYVEGPEVKVESSPLGGSDPYSCSKVAAEEVVRAYRSTYKAAQVSLSVVRGGNIIGGGDWSKNRLVPDLIKATLNERELLLRHPDSIRPWQHVLDLVFSYSLLAWNMLESPGPVTSAEYNVGPDPDANVSVKRLLSLFAENHWPMNLKVQAGTNHEASILLIDSSRFKESTGWEPRIDTPKAVQLTSQWYLAVVRDKMSAHEETRRQILEYLNVG